MLLRNRHDPNLHWSQPDRKRTGIVLDQYPEEPLHRPEQRTMHHHWLVQLSICALVLQLEPRRKIEVELHRRKLPQPSQDIYQLDVNLRPIERTLTGDALEGHTT